MKNKKGSGFRTAFVLFCFAATIASLVVARPPMTKLWVTLPVVLGFVFYLVASVALQVAHSGDGRPLFELAVVTAYPFLVYLLVFRRLDVGSGSFWAFPGVFYFLMITGGFILGTVLSPLLARRKGHSWAAIGDTVWTGLEFLKGQKLFGSALIVLPALLISLAGAALYFSSKLWVLKTYQKAELFVLLAIGTSVVIFFTFKHTVFGMVSPGDKAGRLNSPESNRS
ncbi:MAG: hypothetical protein MUQ00_02755 [Candidatus Aminicenantes bacterium]|nr:hypothetical protein [Candidatus Aminicenantes bacterium]